MGQVIFWNLFLVLFLWIVVNLTNTEQVQNAPDGSSTLGHKEIGVKKGHLSCICGKLEKTREKYFDFKVAQKFFQEAANYKDIFKNISNYPEVKEFADCLRCNFTFVNCDDKGNCAKKTIKFSSESSMNQAEVSVNKLTNSTADEKVLPGHIPIIIDIPIGGLKNHSRLPRSIGCAYPTAMETAAISCRIYPSSIKCTQRCAFGHTLDNGILKEMECKFKDNRWVPSGFKECVPFVDCTVTMSSGGTATCGTASVEEPPVCKIECLAYEDKSQLPMEEYRCKIDGTWEPALPFCAIPGSGMVLAAPPKVKLHTEKSD